MRLRFLVAAAALLSASLAAHADVVYSYQAGAPSSNVTGTYFTVIASDFLSYSDAFLAVSSGEDFFRGQDEGPVRSVQFSTDGIEQANYNHQSTTVFYSSYNIAMDGVYTDRFGSTLTISGSPTVPVAPTPEPSSIALLGTGLLGVAGIVRKRLA